MFELFKGFDWVTFVTVTEPSGSCTSLTGLDLRLQLRRRTGQPVLVELNVGSGITLRAQSGDTLGQADIVLAGADSLDLAAGSHVVSMLLEGVVVMPPTFVQVRTL